MPAGAAAIAVMPIPEEGLAKRSTTGCGAPPPRVTAIHPDRKRPIAQARQGPDHPAQRRSSARNTPSPIRDLQAAYLHEMRGRWIGHHPAGAAARHHRRRFREILKLANETRTAVVPQGGNTGLVGG